MVRGLEIFRSFFKEYVDNYILIGGAACDDHMNPLIFEQSLKL